MIRILIVGPHPDAGAPATNVVGGSKVVTAEMVRELRARGFAPDIVDTAGDVTNLPRWRLRIARLARFLRMVRGVVRRVRRARLVLLHVADLAAPGLAPPVWAICRIARRPLVLRVAGGNLSGAYRSASPWLRRLADRTWLRSPRVYVQTRRSVLDFCTPGNFRWLPNTRNCPRVYVETRQSLRDFGAPAHFRWFPNTRNCAGIRRHPGGAAPERLIFLARLEMDKGLAEALEACRRLPERCRLHVFGPPMSGTDMSLFADHPRASYGGVLEPEEVPGVLSEHDLLVFPSYWGSEGHPGVVLEAFQCGLPVVAARWGGVPELVEHEVSGLLVAPRSSAALWSAIERMLHDPDLYRRLCEGAVRRGEQFRSTRWYGRMASDLRGLCGSERGS